MKILSANFSKLVFFTVFSVKLAAYIFLSGEVGLVGGGNDADYYHNYAIGQNTVAVNGWPVLLNYLAQVGLYSREGVSIALFILSSIFIPLLFSRIVVRQIQIGWLSSKVFWNSLLLIILYPTLLFYSFDVYRDVLMYSCFLIAVYFLSKHLLLYKQPYYPSIYLFFFLLSSYFCLLLRGYLGVAVFMAFLIFPFVKINKNHFAHLISYFALLVICYHFDAFQSIVDYRGEDGFTTGGTTLGISLIEKSGMEFLFLYLRSMVVQLFGFYFGNIQGVLAFLAESAFFIICFCYVVKNLEHLTPLLSYLLVFFVVYNTIWLLGNDNLGTALRLRVFGYLSIYLCTAIIFFRKKYSPIRTQRTITIA